MSVAFEQVAKSGLYQVPSGASVGWCAYLLSPQDDNPNAPIPLQAALTGFSGSFVFAPAAPSFTSTEAANDFVSAVQNWLAPSGVPGRYCVWLPSAAPLTFGAPSFSDSNAKYFAFSFSRQIAGLTLQSDFNANVGTNLFLSIPSGIFLDTQQDSLHFRGLSPFIAINCPATLSFTVASTENAENEAYLPFSGNCAGCLVLAGKMTITPGAGNLLIGMQFAHGNPGAPDTVQPFPLLDSSAAQTMPYLASFDPLDPICAGPLSQSQPAAGIYRTIVTLPAPGAEISLPSCYRTATNQPVHLLPVASGSVPSGPAAYDAGFVFQPVTPKAIDPATGLPVSTTPYVAPVGNYRLGVAGSTTGISVLCGLAGTETLNMTSADGTAAADLLRFVACSPAYTPVFPLPAADLSNPSSGVATPPLPQPAPGATAYLTSWAEVIAGAQAAPTYSAQPEGNPLFGQAGPYGNGSTVVGALHPTTTLGPVSFPLAPWAGVPVSATEGIPPDQWSSYDAKVLSATRRNAILASARPLIASAKAARAALAATAAPPAVIPNGTTPQGLLAQIETAGGQTDYAAVILAQSQPDPAQTPIQMAFLDMSPELQGLFQTNQLFAVIVNDQYVGTSADGRFANTVDVAGWTMQANVGGTASSSNVSNVLILKFCVGTLVDLAATPSAWVDPADFSNPDVSSGVAVLSQALQDYFANAIAKADAGNTLYANFKAIVTNPQWQGVLVLAADMTPEDLPPQLAGLAAGIDFSQFRAHHFGVTASPVHFDGQNFSIPGQSSFFGLVDYQLPAYVQNLAAGGSPTQPLPLPASGDYDFTVLQLQSLFYNSTVIDFRSHVQVTINKALGSTVTASYAGATRLAANGVVLTGYYQSQGDTGTYLFESDATTVMVPDSNVLDALVIDKMIYNTLTSNDGATPPNILSRILIWGSLDFAVLNDGKGNTFDVMSYGMPVGTDAAQATGGLAFSNLHIDMSSPVESPNMTTYRIVETDMVFDQAGSLLRAGSTAAGLALQPQRFVAATAGTTPAAKGYLPVRFTTGAPPQLPVSQDWYGISFLVNMGGPGALASAAGFTSQLLFAWSPQSARSATSYAAFAGLQLPGASPGASAFSLQGVVKLTVGSLSLSYAPIDNGVKPPTYTFTLCLGDIAVSFLGLARLPSSASIDMFLFGDPNGTGSLGWYAAYVENSASANARLATSLETAQ
ncbi:hypothetical protein [Burkholderia cepacia]|uniref:hypothetical protein n=1 Tax=Burkholderia cepacia TaxID=292 RepID=UPI00158D9319|nr:hypothetical protein [Burkholderia cepacia]